MLTINVSDKSIKTFWDESPADAWEFWAFKEKPKCRIGDQIIFKHKGKTIASAYIAKIEAPGQSRCEHSGKFGNWWKVFWYPSSFADLRERKIEVDFFTQAGMNL